MLNFQFENLVIVAIEAVCSIIQLLNTLYSLMKLQIETVDKYLKSNEYIAKIYFSS